MKSGIYGKPVGNCLLMARIDNERWIIRGFFKGQDEKLYVWAIRSFECIETLKLAEQECFHISYTSSSFEFLSNKELLENLI
jgi:hypothetical protein